MCPAQPPSLEAPPVRPEQGIVWCQGLEASSWTGAEGQEVGCPCPMECPKQIQRGLIQLWAAWQGASFLGTDAYCGL